MGLRSLFKSGNDSSEGSRREVNWIPLEEDGQLEEIIQRSETVPQVVCKNSTTCGISGMVRRTFETQHASAEGKADLYLLHIQHHRQLSSEVSGLFGIRHESPQLLIIKNGQVVHHASHGQISYTDLSDWV